VTMMVVCSVTITADSKGVEWVKNGDVDTIAC
jgi:hypothetical protein